MSIVFSSRATLDNGQEHNDNGMGYQLDDDLQTAYNLAGMYLGPIDSYPKSIWCEMQRKYQENANNVQPLGPFQRTSFTHVTHN